MKQPNNDRIRWGNAHYVNFAVGEPITCDPGLLTVTSTLGNESTVLHGDESRVLRVARKALPDTMGGAYVFLADNACVASLTTDDAFPAVHHALTGEALLCVSDVGTPLLDPSRFTFPISRSDGYHWSMSENSSMFAYLRPNRSHEGIDLDLTTARGRTAHPVVAIENSTVVWVAEGNRQEGCVLLASETYAGIYYVYQHLNRDTIRVSAGDHLSVGDRIACVWGDGRWGHLHFSVLASGQPPTYEDRYQCVLNCFPQLYELWHGDLLPRPTLHSTGDFDFAGFYWSHGNTQYLEAYSDLLGFGWHLGAWCGQDKVDRSIAGDEGVGPDQSAVVGKVMHSDSAYPAVNPHDYCDFRIRVVPGQYKTRLCLGDAYGPSRQEITVNGRSFGMCYLAAGQFSWTPETDVDAGDGYLEVRLRFGPGDRRSAIRRLLFSIVEAAF